MAADETRESETGEEPIIVLVDVFHHWPGFPSLWPSAGSPPGGGFGASVPPPPQPPPPAPNYPNPYPRWSGFYLPDWFGDFLGVLAAVAAIMLVTFGLFALGQWLFDDDPGASAPPRKTGLTMPQILHSEQFKVSGHALCDVTSASDGTKYKLRLNRGRGCARSVEVTLPVEQVTTFHSRYVRRDTATFVFSHRVYDAAGVKAIRAKALGRQLKVDLRNVIIRLTPETFRRLK